MRERQNGKKNQNWEMNNKYKQKTSIEDERGEVTIEKVIE